MLERSTGVLYEPTRIKRLAKAQGQACRTLAQADAHVMRIMAEAQVEPNQMHERALQSLAYEEARKQENMDSVIVGALPLLSDKAQPEKIDEDWLQQLFEKVKVTSDKDVQKIWSRLLAGEADAPGTFSKRTLNILHSMSRKEAEMFEAVVNFTFIAGPNKNNLPIILDYKASIYIDNGVNFHTLQQLESIGLVNNSFNADYIIMWETPCSIFLPYQGGGLLHLQLEKGEQFARGCTVLTDVGEEIAKLTTPTAIEGFVDYLYKNKTKMIIKRR